MFRCACASSLWAASGTFPTSRDSKRCTSSGDTRLAKRSLAHVSASLSVHACDFFSRFAGASPRREGGLGRLNVCRQAHLLLLVSLIQRCAKSVFRTIIQAVSWLLCSCFSWNGALASVCGGAARRPRPLRSFSRTEIPRVDEGAA